MGVWGCSPYIGGGTPTDPRFWGGVPTRHALTTFGHAHLLAKSCCVDFANKRGVGGVVWAWRAGVSSTLLKGKAAQPGSVYMSSDSVTRWVLTKPLTTPETDEVWFVGRVVEAQKSRWGYEVSIGDGHFYLVPPDYLEPAKLPPTAWERLLQDIPANAPRTAQEGLSAGEGPRGGGGR